jgi:hypothetical protein
MLNGLSYFYFVTIFILYFNIIKCNLWDNIYSQLYSPHYTIPDETKLELFNNDIKIIEILTSKEYNLIKISMLDKNITQTNNSIVDIFINFSKGLVTFDYVEKCVFKNVSDIKRVNVKFLIESYDLLTFFNNTADYYEYIFTNPLGQQNKNEVKKHRFTLQNINYDIEMINKVEAMLKSEIKSILNQNAYANFMLNKTSEQIERVTLKYNDVYLPDLVAKSYNYTSFTEGNFTLRHNSCELINDDDDGGKTKSI